nr:putative magnesium transporter NIPA8 [Ipomoea batatas]
MVLLDAPPLAWSTATVEQSSDVQRWRSILVALASPPPSSVRPAAAAAVGVNDFLFSVRCANRVPAASLLASSPSSRQRPFHIATMLGERLVMPLEDPQRKDVKSFSHVVMMKAVNLIVKAKPAATTIDSAGGLPASDSNGNVRPPHLLDMLSSGRSRAMASFDPVLPALLSIGGDELEQ